MVYQKVITSALLLGAGAGFAVARPHAGHHGHQGTHSPKSYPFTVPGYGTGVSPSSIPLGTGSAIVPTGTAVYPTAPIVTGSVVSVKKESSSDDDDDSSSSSTKKSSNSTSAAVSASTGSSSSSSSSNSIASSGSSKSGTATLTADSGCTFTDADTAIASKASCTNIVLKDITIPAGETLDMTDLTDGTTVQFQGTTSVEYEEWEGPIISFSGTDITITGASGHVIDGNGAKWWDGEGSNGGKTKPKFFYVHKLIDSTIEALNIQNYPVQCFSVNGAENLSIKDVTIDNSAGDELNSDGDSLGHNTDAFDVGSSTGVYISGATVKNQDDCLAINSGTDISFTDGSCSGGHGLSIGSVGGRSDNDVANVYIADNTISDSDNGVRIKTVYDATGSVKNVTYSGITLSSIAKYGIVIQQDYENGSPTGTPTDGVPITDLTISDVTGSVADDAEEVYILCASCSDWTWSGVSITGGEKSSDCEGVPTGASC
ncbi:Endopolygalacturonase 1 [Fulvia fulva]|uniref:endo-polygalacturonase n=1 Tax=Passalora fulva TaxID=5499 RepID=A0A9Q8PI24_PASFU|nr:Endopolygalacturonase 1 [Fulvia fulva]KAK4626600.1 Endopolygalacturonase 1 [Fulvia fulva]KAK4627668.1 Endopolygalacturonase 1 [Fulvia fulva]UJO22816.1 Endopolygalacturonase 1 [Fulvia fulva]WPV13172.1 Endopolygalacturonase 1 [Fulvia fulva]WPV29352.1 Endopolygalacturonase 1 [Fulvia fulva]